MNQKLQAILSIKQKDLGVIELSAELDIDTVTDVFIRINSKGTVLSQADFEKMLEGFNSREVKCKCKRKTIPGFWNDATSLNQNYFQKNTLL